MTSSVFSSLFAYTIASIFLAISPGPDLLLVLRSATKNSLGSAMGVILGIVTSLFLWGLATILGLNALLCHFKAAFNVLKYAGVFYLIYLGIRLLRSKSTDVLLAVENTEKHDFFLNSSFLHGYKQGIVTNLLNPMIGVLFLVVFPGFIPHGIKPTDIQLFTLILTFIQMSVAFTVFSILALAAQPISAWLRRGKGPVWIDRIAGLSLLYFAVKLFWAFPPI